MKTYAGIGSRETPEAVLGLMEDIAMWFQLKGWTLRSGGALGADRAFEKGAGGSKRIFRAADCSEEACTLAAGFHPAWDKCSEYAKRLHGRNMMIVSGENLDSPVEMVICWTKDGKASGGTGQALRYSQHLKVPIFNLYFPSVREAISAQIVGKHV